MARETAITRVSPPQAAPLDDAVDPIPPTAGGVVRGRAMGMIDHRHARHGRRQAAHQRRPHGVGVKNTVVAPADDAGHPDGRRQDRTFVHIGTSYNGALRDSRIASNAFELDARESDAETELGQTPGQQVLHPLRPRVVLAVDQVQDADRLHVRRLPRRTAGGTAAGRAVANVSRLWEVFCGQHDHLGNDEARMSDMTRNVVHSSLRACAVLTSFVILVPRTSSSSSAHP